MRHTLLLAFVVFLLSCSKKEEEDLFGSIESFSRSSCFDDVCKKRIVPFTENWDWMGRGRFVILKSGEWLMTYQEGSRHRNNASQRCNITFSNDLGNTWSIPNTNHNGDRINFFPIKGVGGSSSTQNSFVTKVKNKIVLIVENRIFDPDKNASTYLGHYRYISEDEGNTWFGPTYLSNQFEGDVSQQWAMYYSEVVGEDMYVSLTSTDGNFWHRAKCTLYKSSDYGLNWEKVSDMSNYDDITYEGGVAYLGDNKMVFVARSRQTEYTGFVMKTSDDMGASWSELQLIDYLDGGINQPYVKYISELDRIYIAGRSRKDECIEFCNWSNSIYWFNQESNLWIQKDLHEPVKGDAGYTQCEYVDGTMYCIGMEGTTIELHDSELFLYEFTP